MADSLGIFVESGTLFLGGAGNDATIRARRGLFSVVGTISSSLLSVILLRTVCNL